MSGLLPRRAALLAAGIVALVVAALSGAAGKSHLDGIDPEKIEWKSKTDAYWRESLNPAVYAVCRQGGTEKPFSGVYDDFKGKGVFVCSSCGLPLFDASDKFDSGTGWPSFTRAVRPDAVELRNDWTFGLFRSEVVCHRCGAHLGHVFDDGPPPTAKRYCINSVCLLHRGHEG